MLAKQHAHLCSEPDRLSEEEDRAADRLGLGDEISVPHQRPGYGAQPDAFRRQRENHSAKAYEISQPSTPRLPHFPTIPPQGIVGVDQSLLRFHCSLGGADEIGRTQIRRHGRRERYGYDA